MDPRAAYREIPLADLEPSPGQLFRASHRSDWAIAVGRAQNLERLPRTEASIMNGRWHINGQVTYPGAGVEGLLLNVRMVNATFEDRTRPEFNAEANSDELIAQIPDYLAHGVRAFTLNLQGGMPGYEGAVNSAFHADGSLRDSYMARVRRVIEACDRLGAVVILGCYGRTRRSKTRTQFAPAWSTQ